MITLCLALLLAAPPLQVGARAPDFTVADATGAPCALKALLSRGPVVLAFYPKAFTSGCTDQMRNYVKGAYTLQQAHATVVAVSGDDAATLQRFAQQLRANYLFVPDPQAELMQLYGVRAWPLKMARRVTFIIAPENGGTIARIDRGEEARAADGTFDYLNARLAPPVAP